MRVLIVEDEEKLAAAVRESLGQEGIDADIAATGEDAFYRLHTEAFDLVLLDLMLPGRSGLEILRALRRLPLPTPVLIITARDAVEDRVLGLDAGADDYLVKPFALPELLARIRALLRRARNDELLRLACEDLTVDLVTRRVQRGTDEIDLTRREYDLLVYLLRHQGHAVTRRMLAEDVWAETSRATPLDNVIDVHVSRLRSKLDAPYTVKLIQTVRGVGFRLGR